MSGRVVTNILLAAIALILAFRWWPPLGVVLLALGVVGCLAYAWSARRAKLKKERDASLAAEVEIHYREFLSLLSGLREKHDPEHRWPAHPIAAPDLPAPYRTEIDKLTEAYKGVLVLKFGPSVVSP